MTTYKIITHSYSYEVDVSGYEIIDCRPNYFGIIGCRFSWLRDVVQRHGGTVIPVIEEERPHWLEYRGNLYEFHWQGDMLTRITLHQDGVPNDILFEQLPTAIQNLL